MRQTRSVMGDMPFTVDVPRCADAGLFDRAFALVREIDAAFSPFIATSDVSRMNGSSLAEVDASPDVRAVLDLCRHYERATSGYFSAWDRGRLDPCGLVKGWAIARVAELIDRAGHASYFIDGGGDVLMRGEPPAGGRWRVAIRHPVLRERVVAVVEVNDMAVATSGTYERGPHIWDPHTGEKVTELVSLTVIAPDIVTADVYATAGMAMGRGSLGFLEQVSGVEALAIDRDLQAASTSGFESYVAS